IPAGFRSIFESKGSSESQASPSLMELAAPALEPEQGEIPLELGNLRDWDVAMRFHELRAVTRDSGDLRKIRRISAQAVLERAREIIGSLVHPVQQMTAPWDELPEGAASPEIDLDLTLENSPAVATGGGGRAEASSRLAALPGD